MTKRKFTNRLSIYLVKKEYAQHDVILKNYGELKSKELQGVGKFYYGDSHIHKPSWIKKFFGSSLGSVDLKNSSSKGIFLVEIIKGDDKRIFAIAFGYGWQFINHGVYEERFGLKTALSVIDANHLRKINKKNMAVAPKDTSEQLSQAGIASDFGIDIEQDLICSITGKSKDEANFGKTVTGKDSLSVSAKKDITSIKDFLMLCYDKYLSNDYKREFGWIDQIAEIKDPKLTDELNNKMISNLKNGNLVKTWVAVPEIMEWELVSGFKYENANETALKDDINIGDFLNTLSDSEKTNLSVDILKGKGIYCISAENDEVVHEWSTYSCIYCEELDDVRNKTFLLSNGKWYEIEKDFAQEVNADFQSFRDAGSSVTLPVYNHENEGKYNQEVSDNDANLCCMDRKLINHGGGYGKIEFCDLLTKDKKIIHVKHYGGSSVLSHLFLQGLVSGELYLGDKKFREKVNEKLSDGFKIPDTNSKPTSSEYEIVFGVISSSPNALEIPFFSKVSIRSAKNKLETYGYKVSLLKIPADRNHKKSAIKDTNI